MTLSDASFSAVFSAALQGNPCAVIGLGEAPEPLPIADWTREADADDHEILAFCEGPTLDIGCGPGRLSAALADAGEIVLGIDIVHEAVGQTRERGVSALHRDVFDAVPGEGRWQTALLADGNIGIGGDPVALLGRVRELLDPRGRVVVELAPPGTRSDTVWAALECDGTRSRPFRWSVLAADQIDPVAGRAGLAVAATYEIGRRWVAVLQERR
ncbi:MAG: class I SAM-dependent methyltransferase [Actinomycetota bacterium]|nr:class I SAM-dependent methyltransferase [Actinomycetota bacterium]